MKKIYKYQIIDMKVVMKVGAKILCAHAQGENICLWALIDADEVLEERYFVIYQTGGSQTDILESNTYIDTVHMSDGLVWHVFESSNG